MKIQGKHYETLKTRVLPLLPKVSFSQLVDKKGQWNMAVVWHVFYAAKIFEVYTYQQWNYHDMHIATAMKKIIRDYEEQCIKDHIKGVLHDKLRV